MRSPPSDPPSSNPSEISPHDRQGHPAAAVHENGSPVAVRLRVLGRVQGVGFRPYVLRLAHTCQLVGWVKNTPQGVVAHLEGRSGDVAAFLARFRGEAPPAAEIHEVYEQTVEPCFERTFKVVESDFTGENVLVAITPDLATCGQCLSEFGDPTDRRFAYALSGCTDCGPRFTQLLAPPFDRDRTAMAIFPPAPSVWQSIAAQRTDGFMPRTSPVPVVALGSGSKTPAASKEQSTGRETMRECLLRRASGCAVERLSRSRGSAASICCATRPQAKPCD